MRRPKLVARRTRRWYVDARWIKHPMLINTKPPTERWQHFQMSRMHIHPGNRPRPRIHPLVVTPNHRINDIHTEVCHNPDGMCGIPNHAAVTRNRRRLNRTHIEALPGRINHHRKHRGTATRKRRDHSFRLVKPIRFWLNRVDVSNAHPGDFCDALHHNAVAHEGLGIDGKARSRTVQRQKEV